jgi:phosphatidylglycerophosphate synthase
MQGFVPDSLPGEITMALYLAIGLVVVLPFLVIPRKVLARMGTLPLLSPNWLSIWRLPITWIGYGLYFKVSPLAGFCVVVFSFIMDRLDGKVAAALDELNDPRYPGKTETGKWLDPLIDKLTVPPLFVIFWYLDILNGPLTCFMLAGEIAGTLIRPPFNLFRNHTRTSAASGIGKIKIVLQYACLLLCLPLHMRWMAYSAWWPNVVLGLCGIAGVLSVASRLKLGKHAEKAVDNVTANFNHNE